MESGVSPSGRLKREGGGGVAWLGEVAILDNVAGVMIWLYSSEINARTACSVSLGLKLRAQFQLMPMIGGGLRMKIGVSSEEAISLVG